MSSLVTVAQVIQAPVEVRAPVTPQSVMGSDGLLHVAYELHLTNYYQSTGTLRLKRVNVLASETSLVLASFPAAQLNGLLAHPVESQIRRG